MLNECVGKEKPSIGGGTSVEASLPREEEEKKVKAKGFLGYRLVRMECDREDKESKEDENEDQGIHWIHMLSW